MGKTIEVKIYGSYYKLETDKSPNLALEIAKFVDTSMEEIGAKNPYISDTRVAVLVALNFADDIKRIAEKINRLESVLP